MQKNSTAAAVDAKKSDKEKQMLTEEDFDRQVIYTIIDWYSGSEEVVLLTRPDLESGVLTFDGLTILNCPKKKEEIDIDLVKCAIGCYHEVYNTYMTVCFNYSTIRQDMQECWESCN